MVYVATVGRILTKEAMDLLRIDRKTLFKWGSQKKVKMWRSGPMDIREFDYDEIKRLAERLPKKRGRSIPVFVEKRKKGAL